MEFITCLLLLSTRPVHHLIQIHFSQSGFCSTSKYNFQCLEYKLLGDRQYVSFLFLSLSLTQKVLNSAVEKLNWKEYIPMPLSLDLACLGCLAVCPAHPIHTACACQPGVSQPSLHFLLHKTTVCPLLTG